WWAGFETPYSNPTRWGLNWVYGIDELGGWVAQAGGFLETRLGTRMQLSARPRLRRENQPRQYITTLSGEELDDNGVAFFDHSAGGGATYGSRYVFSRIDRSTLSMQIRANYFFSPDLSLEVYAEPFVATGKFFEHGQVPFAGTIDLSTQGTDGSTIIDNQDGTFSMLDAAGNLVTHPQSGDPLVYGGGNFSALSFRSNVVLRWEFNPGSALYLVWQRNLSGELDRVRSARPGDLFDTVDGEGVDFFALKLSYWLPLTG
ncbi:MAG TPA: hypothetical protein VLB27_02965, partial [candidate division Zixibacteria bacterium]|nr:hypothetical protein [candidate division Zixibacteria bacterium]